jgi:hypothetical protein
MIVHPATGFHVASVHSMFESAMAFFSYTPVSGLNKSLSCRGAQQSWNRFT